MSDPSLGVVVVTYNSSDVILDCLESLLAQAGDLALHVVVVDNASTDGTADRIAAWADGSEPWTPPADLPFPLDPAPKPVALHDGGAGAPPPGVTLVRETVNGGFAAGVNAGLAHLARCPGVDRFWVLNPDGVAAPGAAHAFATQAVPEEGFSLMGGRLVYLETPTQIQIDGGTIDWRTGVTGNLNLGCDITRTPPPRVEEMAFISGASLVASRQFYETAGPMPEEYFLYYEEVDWAMRRGDLPLAFCAEGRVYHRAGTSIGSPTLARIGSPFSQYFKHRARLRFIRRYRPSALPSAWAYSLAKAGQYVLKGWRAEAWALLVGSWGGRPPAGVRRILSPEAAARAFGDRPVRASSSGGPGHADPVRK